VQQGNNKSEYNLCISTRISEA